MTIETVFQKNVKIPNVLHHSCLFKKMFDAQTLNQFGILPGKKTGGIVQNTLIYITVFSSGIEA